MTGPDEPGDTTGREACEADPLKMADVYRSILGRRPDSTAPREREHMNHAQRERDCQPSSGLTPRQTVEALAEAKARGAAVERARGDDGRAGAYAAGVAAERARIVARLRVTAREVAEGDAGMSATEWLDSEADAIEAGEHGEKR